MSDSTIELKGSGFTLSVLHLQSSNVAETCQALADKIKQAPQFFKMAPIVINIEKLDGAIIDFTELKQKLADLDVVPVGISGATDKQKSVIKAAGLACLNEAKSPTNKQSSDGPTQVRYERVEVPVEVKVPSYTPSKILRQNLRSGQQIYAKDSDLVIIGMVSNGAEVIADGSIHIYGQLRGRAIAGASGDESARIFCHKLEAELVSINGNYWTSEQLQDSVWGKAGYITLDGDSLSATELEI
ncbi:septum site-determining protein MinC [Catenovulum maritimum]|uniref:Probable septum site-determining protein MinC n=1 Tax=Catenovulum maritimum TaxID=1513271 RepID=A0A0J8GUV3_9ALTE|nr:septum site-determining protein MinC [Catenovulum maritimum]KMT66507.1 hypothetical protein XM47_02930 [Catenovulum maritimum]